MKNAIFSAFLAVSMLLQPAGALAAEQTDNSQKSAVLYMSTDGKYGDERAYTSLGSLKTAIASLSNDIEDVTVIVKGGTYRLNSGVVIDDTTLKGKSLTIKAAEGEVPEFTGSKAIDISQFRPITDKKLLENMHESAKSHVGQIDLAKQGFTREQVDFTANYAPGGSLFPLGIYLNDTVEKLSSFPNSSYLRIGNVINMGGQRRYATGQGNCAVFEVAESNVRRWGTAKNAYVKGFIGAEYYEEWAKIGSVDTESQRITLADWSQYGVRSGYKWSIVNLLEEVDVPGEWYIDFETLTLYYYPRYPLNKKEDKLEIALVKEPLLTLNNLSNVTLSGLTFKNASGDGIKADSCTDLTIEKCKVYNLSGTGIYLSNAYRNFVTACDVYETGNRGIYLYSGGDRNLLKSNECVISNNHIFRTGRDTGDNWSGGVQVGRNTVGTLIRNNLIHGIKNYSVAWGGNDTNVSHNEIWNGNRETADSCPTYCGRNWSEYGSTLTYNYIHDCVNKTSSVYANSLIMTGDDWQSGTTIENNILHVGKKKKGTATGTYSRDNTIRYNICIEAEHGVEISDRHKYVPNLLTTTDGTTGGLVQSLTKSDGLKEGYALTPAWQAKYPQISRIYSDLVKDNGRFVSYDNIITDNVSVDAPNTLNNDLIEKYSTIERNLDIDDYGIFVDPENHDFRITDEAMEKYNLDEHLMSESNFSMDEIGINPEVKNIQKPEGEFRKLYPANGESGVQRENLNLMWERALYADEYHYVVARDAALTDIVAEGDVYDNTVVIEGLENDTNYYWNVTAKNLSKQIGNEWSAVGDAYLFKTAKFDKLDKTLLLREIENAEALIAGDNIKEGENVGDFEAGTKAIYEEAINEAKKTAAITYGTTSMITDAVKRLQMFTNNLDAYKIKGYTTITLDEEKWNLVSRETFTNEFTDEGYIIAASAAVAGYTEKIPSNKMVQFKVKPESFDSWFGFAVKQKDYKNTSYAQDSNSYLIVVKKDIFEFQKYNAMAAKKGIIKTAPNNGIISENKWANVTFGAVNVPGGVNVRLEVDGQVIFDYYDSEIPNYEDGYFVLTPSTKGSTTTIAPADNVSEEVFVPDSSIFSESAAESVTLKTDDSDYTETGEFTDVAAKGYESDKVRASQGGTAEWNKAYKAGADYTVYYWHTPLENGDKNATVEYETAAGISGSFIFNRKVDFSTGEPGWRKLGTFTALSPDGQTGIVNVKIIGSGAGQIPVSAIKVDTAIGDEAEFSKFFYGTNKNVMVMKIGSETYYSNIEELKFESMPQIVSNRTCVPLRSIAENYGFNVDYADDTKQITLTNSEHTIVFKLDELSFTVDGAVRELEVAPFVDNDRTLLPLRALSEAIGKTVFYDDNTKIIAIGDKLDINESSKNSYSTTLAILSECIDKAEN